MAPPPQTSFNRTVGSISGATFISRILGLVRDQVQSYFFGAGLVTDAFVAAFRVPNLLRDLFAEGALSSAFVPTFIAERERRGRADAWRLANRLITVLLLILGAITLLIALGAPWILQLYVGGFADEPRKMALTVTMTRILAPFLLFVALAAVAMGMLNSCGRFFLPALAPAAFNVAAILGVLLLAPLLPRFGFEPVLALAIGALAGGALQFLVQVPSLRREGFRLRLELAPTDPGLRRIGLLMLPATLGLAATQVNILVDTMLASRYENGSVTWLTLAFRLMQLPIGLFGVAIATANLARVSKDAAIGDASGLRANLGSALRAAGLLTLPATAGLIALRRPIVALIFEHGEFDARSTVKTAAAVLCYALGLYAYAVTKIQVPTFYALGDTRTPVWGSVGAVGLKISASLALITWLPRVGIDAFLGLALSTSLAAWFNFTWLSVGLRRRIGPLAGERILRSTASMLVLSGALGVAAGASHAALCAWLPGGGLPGETARLGAAVLAGLAVLALGLPQLDLPELRSFVLRVRALVRRRPPAAP